jgi:hypothetical protein
MIKKAFYLLAALPAVVTASYLLQPRKQGFG